ncbi:hypothetical protein JVU11DRAFT_11285 [Chiua virens]|nr:hypothetical protein JVU11DRAFT_11285 [Chiua virens]
MSTLLTSSPVFQGSVRTIPHILRVSFEPELSSTTTTRARNSIALAWYEGEFGRPLLGRCTQRVTAITELRPHTIFVLDVDNDNGQAQQDLVHFYTVSPAVQPQEHVKLVYAVPGSSRSTQPTQARTPAAATFRNTLPLSKKPAKVGTSRLFCMARVTERNGVVSLDDSFGAKKGDAPREIVRKSAHGRLPGSDHRRRTPTDSRGAPCKYVF